MGLFSSFLPAEAETRQRLLRTVKKEVGAGPPEQPRPGTGGDRRLLPGHSPGPARPRLPLALGDVTEGLRAPKSSPEPTRARLRVPGDGAASLQRWYPASQRPASLENRLWLGAEHATTWDFPQGKRGDSRCCFLPLRAGMG